MCSEKKELCRMEKVPPDNKNTLNKHSDLRSAADYFKILFS